MTADTTKAAAQMNHPLVKHSLWLALEHTVNRYLMSNAHGRQSGAEKAQRHDELCCHYVATFRQTSLDKVKRTHEDEYQRVREHTRQLTDHLDTVIGFPLNSTPDYEDLASKFFTAFHLHAVAALCGSAAAPAEDEHPAMQRMRQQFEEEYGVNHPIASALRRYREVHKDYDASWNRDREKPVTAADVAAAEHAVFDAAADVYASGEVSSEVQRLRGLAATCYAGLGAECELPEEWLDVLSAAADGEAFDTSSLLPFSATHRLAGAESELLTAALKAIRERLVLDPAAHAESAIQMIDALLAGQENVRPA
ncbi:hypothetical protein [Paracidovorax wautersii]|uniref:Uncharacterized protein n=1 Tax=Paracidovorax wautersii TaxID=1177982 RepID=A0A1I2HUA0_9BURK|nr:hypothetical protein [Paracidovorax wautersii]SFF33342.1 hypothetical protein SAMN04489711_13413 [Paracidovorax wautersii]